MGISKLKIAIAKELCKKFNLNENEAMHCIEYAKPGFADLAIKIFGIAKKSNKKPDEIYNEIKEWLENIYGIESIEFKNNYVNINLSDSILAESLSFKDNPKKNVKTVIEFPSVNPNKPWHIGHLRNALLGESISRILEFSGENVERLDYINDLGLQVAESFFYFKNYVNKINQDEKFDLQAGKDYVEAHRIFEENIEMQKKTRELLKQMEKGDKEAREFSEKVVESQYKTAFDYGIKHDAMIFESDIILIIDKGLELLKKSNELELCNYGKNKGCFIIKLDEKNKENEDAEKVLIRSDNTITYTGKDIVFHLWKFGKLKGIKFKKLFMNNEQNLVYSSSLDGKDMHFGNAEKVINIVGIEQTYTQNIVKHALNLLGYKKEADNLIHLAYAFVKLKESRFSGRKGIWIGYTADDLLKEAIERIKEKNNKLDDIEIKKIALAAIKFAFLKIGNTKEIIFDWDRVLSTEGDSGIYLLYSYVRALSLIKNSTKKQEMPKKIRNELKQLVIELSKFNEVVENSAKNLDTTQIANYLLELSRLFHSAYSKSKFLGSDDEGEIIFIINKYAEIMKKGMYLLGIETVEKM